MVDWRWQFFFDDFSMVDWRWQFFSTSSRWWIEDDSFFRRFIDGGLKMTVFSRFLDGGLKMTVFSAISRWWIEDDSFFSTISQWWIEDDSFFRRFLDCGLKMTVFSTIYRRWIEDDSLLSLCFNSSHTGCLIAQYFRFHWAACWDTHIRNEQRIHTAICLPWSELLKRTTDCAKKFLLIRMIVTEYSIRTCRQVLCLIC
jgi:hypothetical protein